MMSVDWTADVDVIIFDRDFIKCGDVSFFISYVKAEAEADEEPVDFVRRTTVFPMRIGSNVMRCFIALY
jgi:hypothetical protein